ncbi:MAG: hypothetical protein WDN25_18530 [Acetobacteraceae bacterium]
MVLGVWVAVGGIATARAETAAATCRRLGTSDTLRPITEAMVPAVNALFGTALPPRMAIDTTVFRCADRQVLVCTTGANLPCGKANASRTAGPGTVQWCRDNPDADFVPAVATGHDSLYEWRCRGGVAQVARQTAHVDRRGFVAEYWRTLK